MKAKVNRDNITRHLIEYQLEMWYFNITMTQEQHKEFRGYAIPLLKKIFKFNKARAEQTFDWFNLTFGLRIKS
jgi:hypothetical protein